MPWFPLFQTLLVRQTFCALICTAFVVGFATSATAKSKRKRRHHITKPKFIPQAKKVTLWEALKEEQIKTRVIAQNEQVGKVLFENKSDKPLTILLPESFVAVPINAQILNNNFPNGRNGQNFSTGTFGNRNNSRRQSIGGNFGNRNNSNFGTNGGNNQSFRNGFLGTGSNFFSIPAGKIVSIPFRSVCLEHGKKEPTRKTKLTLIPTKQFTKNKNLQELLTFVGNNRPNQKAIQAATWHLANNMSWQQLDEKSIQRLGGFGPQAYFTRAELDDARKVITLATEQVKTRVKNRKTYKGYSQLQRIQRVSAKK
ncbi:hypothetical protein MNBD_PLANCTO02-1048 [hydrothermal vent metagenome]|uniref:Uncharacterized protein n=1 Tax=hydrothermal vent metagenome TaxID=652676 RepID=A0A3B1DUG7_9ZZZZ